MAALVDAFVSTYSLDAGARERTGYGSVGTGIVLTTTLETGEVRSKESSLHDPMATRREGALAGIAAAARMLRRPVRLTVFTDQDGVRNAYDQGHINLWARNGWKTSSGERVEGHAAFARMYEACLNHNVVLAELTEEDDREFVARARALARAAALGCDAGALLDEAAIRRLGGRVTGGQVRQLAIAFKGSGFTERAERYCLAEVGVLSKKDVPADEFYSLLQKAQSETVAEHFNAR